MRLLHEDRDFAELVRIAGARHDPPLAPALVEKDYWVVHSLWSIAEAGLESWFKGGTSLSKGFQLIQRFSEDLDVKLGSGSVGGIETVRNWKSDGATHVRARRSFFEGLHRHLRVEGASVHLFSADPEWRHAEIHVRFRSVVSDSLPPPMKPFVVIEAGNARVVPFVARDIEAFVHGAARQYGALLEFRNNAPRAVRCVHPIVTLIEKLDAIQRRFHDPNRTAASFVRHYEDAAAVIAAIPDLPSIPDAPGTLLSEMLASREIRSIPRASDACFRPNRSARWEEIRAAHAEAQSLYFGKRRTPHEACRIVRRWLSDVTG